MKRMKWLVGIFVLFALLFTSSRLMPYVLAAVDAAFNIYLPIVIKQEPPTPTPTQNPFPPGIFVLPNHSDYVTSWGSLHIVGEVMNNTNTHMDSVKVSVIIFNDGGQLVDTDYTYTYLYNLPAGYKTCFDILIYDPPSDWSYYQFETPTYWTNGQPLPNLTVINESATYDPHDDDYQIIGQVRNDHGNRVEYVKPVGTVYNAVGTVLGCSYNFVNSTHLDPGQVSAFKLIYYGNDYADVTSYVIQVDGNQ